MNRRHFCFYLLCFVLCLSLSGCAVKPAAEAPAVTIPPTEVSYVAPIGDAALEYSEEVTLCLPMHDGIRLSTVTSEVSFSPVRPYAENVVRALLGYTGNGEIRSIGGDVRLTLYGTSPVEVSRNVATVNLGASALQLSRQDLYVACQSIANTLTLLDEIDYVNVLVAGKPVGLDVANSLPMGSLTGSAAQDLGAAYGQLISRPDSDMALSTTLTLYFPLATGDGLAAEARSVSFASQNLPDMVVTILKELAAGPQSNGIDSPALPLLGDLLTATPSVSSENGGDILRLDFAHNLDDMLETYGLTRQQSMASLCYTLCTFLPNVNGIRVSVNGVAVDSLLRTEDGRSQGASFLRADFEDQLCDYAPLYLADGDTLVKTLRPVPCYQASSPRMLLSQLSQGPQPSDSVQGLTAVMPQGCITDTALLGLAISQNTLLVNFAPAFSQTIENAADERLMAYAIVNTLCAGRHIKNVCFFLGGSQFDGFGGSIYWRGLFYPLPEG